MKKTLIRTISTLSLAMAASFPMAAMADAQDQQRNAEIVEKFQLISSERAKEVALAEVPGGVVKEIDLDERSRSKGWKWEVEVVNADGKEFDVDVDARTGEILEVDKSWF